MALPKRKRGGVFAVLVVVAVVASLLVVAPVAGSTTDGVDYGNGYMIVELASSPLAHNDATKVSGRFDVNSPAYAQAQARLEREHARFVDRLAKTAPEAEIVNQMFVTSNSVVLKLNGASPASIEAIGGVHRTSPSDLYYLDMNESVGLIGADTFWNSIGGSENAGAGVKVGIIDSGINPDHPFFACKDVNFGGVYYSGVGILPQIPAIPAIFGPGFIPGPGDPLYSSDPHGTHVAGTVAGCVTTIADGSVWDGTPLSGVAPGAELWDYNVFPYFGAGMVAFGGSAFSHDIAAAIEDAVLDGMDVINMSLGGGVQGPHDFLAEVSNAAVAAGVTVVTSAGNEGPGWYTVGSPGSAEDVIAVGASTSTRGMGVQILIDGWDPIYAVPGEFPDFDGGLYDVVDWGGEDNEACSAAGAPAYSGEVVIIARGSCTFSQKMANAKAAGAGGVIVYTYPGEAPIGMAKTAGFDDDIPAVMVTRDDGNDLEAVAPVSATITPPVVVPANPDLLAGFSSRGPAPFTNIVKPDVVAPGVNILSSVQGSGTILGMFGAPGWELYNGTSMASPHVAGAAAALLGEHDWSPAMVKSALVSTANADKPGLSVFEQGGGLIDLPTAGMASTFFAPASASFGITKGNKPASGSIDIAITGGACSVVTMVGDYASAEVDGDTLTVSFDGGRDAGSGFYGGYVNLDCDGDAYHIPWGAVVNR